MSTRTYEHPHPFQLESGAVLPGFRLAYTTLGQPEPDGSNTVWIFHALTGSANVRDWWPGLVGAGRLFDPARHYIVCANMPGSCYGSTGPLDVDPASRESWYHDFPFFTPRDMARAFIPLRKHLGIEHIAVGIGGSMGGQHLLEWAVEEPTLFGRIIPIATNACHSAWGRAFNASQRMCIEADPSWKERHPAAGLEGMKVARSLALLSYRHYQTYSIKQADDPEKIEEFRSESYQRYQGEKLAARFNAFSYHTLSKGMDAHHLGRKRGSIKDVLATIQAKTLAIGIDTDILYPPEEQEWIAAHVPGGKFELIKSTYGHDAFLIENEQLVEVISPFLS
ncbi:MAG: homoserine O-acetyltransferase [Bacteroidetes bacterium]|nr:homoserine O-acetyltransferase [Bacteroidota bacterium]